MARYLLLAVALLVPGPAWPQGLGEAARKEKERRAASKSPPTRVYTEDDLPASGSPKPAKPTSAKPAPGKKGPPAAQEPEPDQEGAPTEESTDARYRRLAEPIKERLEACQSRLEDAGSSLRAAEKRVADLRADVIITGEGEWARRRVEDARAEVERLKRECDDIEDEARQQGIPPGYVR